MKREHTLFLHIGNCFFVTLGTHCCYFFKQCSKNSITKITTWHRSGEYLIDLMIVCNMRVATYITQYFLETLDHHRIILNEKAFKILAVNSTSLMWSQPKFRVPFTSSSLSPPRSEVGGICQTSVINNILLVITSRQLSPS